MAQPLLCDFDRTACGWRFSCCSELLEAITEWDNTGLLPLSSSFHMLISGHAHIWSTGGPLAQGFANGILPAYRVAKRQIAKAAISAASAALLMLSPGVIDHVFPVADLGRSAAAGAPTTRIVRGAITTDPERGRVGESGRWTLGIGYSKQPAEVTHGLGTPITPARMGLGEGRRARMKKMAGSAHNWQPGAKSSSSFVGKLSQPGCQLWRPQQRGTYIFPQ
ncbi:hypothetical protein B0H67DRAFT_118495 [Lasiosphaeris hirsuta]|uniref:Uncharacterized protein n=1 Tax=Lasiosphaeris hirsuta TaxID=260670 RepID=A0AA40AZL1_9PEZI|nr:hypothetical protein B0H67DRAFT_118495 [Lasiosphaeris hirsuta]